MKKEKHLLVCIGTLLITFGGCVHIDNPVPSKVPTSEIASVEQVATAAKAIGDQSDIVALAEQTKQMLDIMGNSYRLQQATYNERAGGTEYDESMRTRLEQAIPIEWKLGEEADKLYQIAKHSRSELASEGMTFAKAVFYYADVSDENDQFALGYVIAGLVKDSNYLGGKNEDIFNALAKKRADSSKNADAMMEKFIAHLAEAQASGAAAPAQFEIPDVGANANNSVEIRITGSKLGKAHLAINADEKALLQKNVEQVVAETSLANHTRKITISMEVRDVDDHTLARYVRNVISLPTIGYVDMGGGKAKLVAFTKEEGGQQVPLAINSFLISAKDSDTLARLVAYRVVGRTEMLFLRENMK